MTEQETITLLAALKIDLGITATAYDERLTQILEAAENAITKEGVTLDLSQLDHMQTVIMYSSWLWKRRETGTGMPKMVRYQLNNLIFHQHNEDE